MSQLDQLSGVRAIRRLRLETAERKMHQAKASEIQQGISAKAGQTRMREAQDAARDYSSQRFKAALEKTTKAHFFESLAVGHHFVCQQADTLAARAERLSERHEAAITHAAEATSKYAKMKIRADQFVDLIDDLTAVRKAADDAAEDEEIQDILAARTRI